MRLLGVDGCPAGWVVAESQLKGGEPPLAHPIFWIVPTFASLLSAAGNGPAVIALDIPIGLASGRPRDAGIRSADRATRAFLGGRRGSSVFAAPCRRTLNADSYRAACIAETEARGVKLSRQVYGILPKIREVDRIIHPGLQLAPAQATGPVLREVHPEVAFARLAGGGAPGYGLTTGKRTASGEVERLALLCPYVGAVQIAAARARFLSSAERLGRGRVVGRDDIVDALACLVVAYRVASGQVQTFPDGSPQLDERGLRMEILA